MINEKPLSTDAVDSSVQMVQKNLESQVNDRMSNSTETTVQKKNGIISLVTENQSQHLSVCIKYIENKQSVPLNNETKTRDEIVQAVPAEKSDSVQCNICKKYFSSNSLRRKHEKEEHPWNLECKVCSLYFQTQANLDFHMRTHEKKQDRINMIREHFQVVLENKQRIKYQCLTCSKNLTSKNSLMNHVKMHKNFEKTLCPICPMRFRSKISLSNHLSRVHGKEDPMNQPTESKDKIENFSDLHGSERATSSLMSNKDVGSDENTYSELELW
ncbi:PR domain zinc finger protein 5 [Trichinella murrelli]|uniref:PR domain zinc finger protein 5 n=1 Tax=Trichinella murrelli TaxID=144512 RepID=A0A0V0TAI5_9BILA|nr:PR domain zinc finger protein 5 [Trichinella murrelli]